MGINKKMNKIQTSVWIEKDFKEKLEKYKKITGIPISRLIWEGVKGVQIKLLTIEERKLFERFVKDMWGIARNYNQAVKILHTERLKHGDNFDIKIALKHFKNMDNIMKEIKFIIDRFKIEFFKDSDKIKNKEDEKGDDEI